MRQQWQWSESQSYFFFEPVHTPPMVKRIIIATVIVFFAQLLLGSAALWRYFSLSPENAVLRVWLWQFVTYLFLHDPHHIFHIIFNMLCLYFFGRDIEVLLGSRKFLFFYLAAGVFAGATHCLVQFSAHSYGSVVGASGAVMAILVAYAFSFPNRLVIFIIFPMRAKTLVLLLIGIDLFYGLQGTRSGVAHFAHLGGALFGFLYWKGRPWLERAGDALREWRESRRRTVDLHEEMDLDRILEKISQYGMDSLSKRERAFLLRASERRRREKAPHEGHS